MMFRRMLSVFSNHVLAYGVQIIGSILSARLLGPQQRGVFVVAVLVAAIISSVAQLGVPNALVYNLARSGNSEEAISEAIALCSRLMPTTVVLVTFSYTLAYWIGRHTMLRGLPPSAVLYSFALAIINAAYAIVLNFLSGLHDFRWRNTATVLPPALILGTLVWYWRSATPISPVTLLSLNAAFTTLAIVAASVHVLKQYRPRLAWRLPDDWRQSYVCYGVKSYVAEIARILNHRLDALILNALWGSKIVGLYSSGVAPAELLLYVPMASALVLSPTVASLPDKDRGRVAVLALGSSLYLVLGGGILMAALLPWVLPYLYGRAFAPAVPAAEWLLPGMLGLTVVTTLSGALAGLGRPEYMTYAMLVGLLASTALDFGLIPRFGMLGAAWASSIAYWLAALTILLLYVRQCHAAMGTVLRGLAVEPALWLCGHRRGRSRDVHSPVTP
jgi:O-antigen/teichoic acid export membrane protein